MSTKTVVVRFTPSGSTYSFLYDGDDTFIGDHVVVQNTNRSFAVAQVVNIEEGKSPFARAWVIQRVDLVLHNARQERARLISEKKTQLDNKILSQRDTILKLLAEKDEETAKLIKDIQRLEAM